MSSPARKSVAIVGAGLSGTLMAIYLARRGHDVEMYERRQDMRLQPQGGGRSINMTLAARGLQSLARVMDLDRIMEMTIPLQGRLVHNLDGSTKFHPYGKAAHEVIYAIKRDHLNIALMNVAETYPNVRINFSHKCVGVDRQAGTLRLFDELTKEQTERRPDFTIGADGTFSAVRQQIHRGICANYQQEFLECGYKELTLPAGPNGSFQLDKNMLHVWPRGEYMLMAIPNLDGSFAMTCILPLEGKVSFAALGSAASVRVFFDSQFPDVAPLLEQLTKSFLEKPTGMFLTTRVHPWHSGGRVVLLGDACHTVVPFYGQGMNAAFEDCAILDECLERHPDDYERAFGEHQSLRKRHTDALADLSVQNFIELRDKVRLPMFIARKQVEHVFERLFSRSWIPLYTLISHMTIPYADAIERYNRQRRIARWLGADVLVLAVASGIMCRNFARRAFDSAVPLGAHRLWSLDDAAQPKDEAAKLEELRRLKNLPTAPPPGQV